MKIKQGIFSIVVTLAIIISTFGVAALGAGQTQVPPENGGQSGTTLSADVTAEGFWERIQEYDWSLIKKVVPTSLTIPPGQQGQVTYTIHAAPGAPTITDRYGVRGQVTVTNGGAVTTQDLTIVAQVQYKMPGPGSFLNLSGAYQALTPAQLPAWQTGIYDYEVEFTPVPGATAYRMVAHVTITNHSGQWFGQPFGPSPKTGFNLPNSPTIIYVDATATLNDVQTIPGGFTATVSPPQTFPMLLTGWTTITFTKTITNVSAAPGTYYLDNTATLTEGTTGDQRQSSARVIITVPESEEPPPPSNGYGGLTPGYWKSHLSAWNSTGYLPTQTVGSVFTQANFFGSLGSATLLQALSFGGGKTFTDAVKILLRQAVAALLNAATPSLNYPLTVSQVITQVNAAIATSDRSIVLALAKQLDGYNNLGAP